MIAWSIYIFWRFQRVKPNPEAQHQIKSKRARWFRLSWCLHSPQSGFICFKCAKQLSSGFSLVKFLLRASVLRAALSSDYSCTESHFSSLPLHLLKGSADNKRERPRQYEAINNTFTWKKNRLFQHYFYLCCRVKHFCDLLRGTNVGFFSFLLKKSA